MFTWILWIKSNNNIWWLVLSMFSYNPLERREASKGGKEASKKPSQPSTKSSTAAPKAQPSHNARKNDASSTSTTNLSVKVSRPGSSGGPAYDEKVLFGPMQKLQFYYRIWVSYWFIYLFFSNADHRVEAVNR